MRRIELIVGGLLWLVTTTLMPMAALEPVQVASADTAPAAAAQL